MRFGLLLKPDRPEASRLAAQLVELLRRRGAQVVVAAEDLAAAVPGATPIPCERMGEAIDVLVVLGGDGTFLRAASLVGDHGVPLLGINLGTLGFLTHYPVTEVNVAVEAALEGRLPIEERMRLLVTVRSGGVAVVSRTALNEAVVQRTGARLLELTAEVDGDVITTYKADGLIVSTPTGSTAYNLAALGPILTPNLEAMVLTPICPHTLTNRPVVVRADARVTATNVSSQPVTVTVDGLWTRDLPSGDAIEVRKAPHPLRTFRAAAGFFSVLRHKLSWGERQG
jgi:NAD+ kinase